jgi:hypothetical protein
MERKEEHCQCEEGYDFIAKLPMKNQRLYALEQSGEIKS